MPSLAHVRHWSLYCMKSLNALFSPFMQTSYSYCRYRPDNLRGVRISFLPKSDRGMWSQSASPGLVFGKNLRKNNTVMRKMRAQSEEAVSHLHIQADVSQNLSYLVQNKRMVPD